MIPSKSQLRKQFEIRRAALSSFEREAAGKAAATRLAGLKLFLQSHRIACYLPYKSEFDATPLIDVIWQAKKTCYLPVLTEETTDNKLRFARYQYGDALHLNRFGILEPAHPSDFISPEHLELVIAPLVAFDSHGRRLGTGGGFYDRTFDFLRGDPPVTTPVIWGLAFDIQEAEALAAESWDIPVSGILTETRFIQVCP